MEANNQLIVDFVKHNARVENIARTIVSGYDNCLNQYVNMLKSGEVCSGDDLLTFINSCTFDSKSEVKEQISSITDEEFGKMRMDLTYNWMTCFVDNVTGFSHGWEQGKHVYRKWEESYKTLKEFYIGEGKAESEAHEDALAQADGSQDCFVNVAGGATFWFTVMSTVGYGNTAPVTVQGRSLVYLMGFVSILLFSAVLGYASSVSLTIVDDFFERVKLKQLTQGVAAAFFWLAIFWLWLLVIAEIYWLWTEHHYGMFFVEGPFEGFKFSDAYWFAFISVTTVGFGDYYFPHDLFRAVDLFYNPLLILIGYVLSANFCSNLAN